MGSRRKFTREFKLDAVQRLRAGEPAGRYTDARKLRHKELNFGARTSLGCRNFLFSTDPATSTVLEQVCWSDAYKRHTWMSASRKSIVRDVLGEHGRGHT